MGFVEQLEEFIPHLYEAKFAGGEPFLIDIAYEIWERIIEINPDVRISIQTNATILNEKVKQVLKRGHFLINISIDSLQKDNYELIRKNAHFDRMMENLIFFYNYCKSNNRHFGIDVCPMRQNWKEIPDFVSFCNEKNVRLNFHTVNFPPHCALWNLSSGRLKEIQSYYETFTFHPETEFQNDNVILFNSFLRQVEVWREESIKRESTDQKVKPEQSKSIDDLKRDFFQRIEDYISGDKSYTLEEKREKIGYARNVYNAVFDSIEQKDVLTKDLQNVSEFSVEMVVAELEISSHERLVERINYAGHVYNS
jgi:MoaA/NifB/PqqE/SkfB family radical SAM enzyme